MSSDSTDAVDALFSSLEAGVHSRRSVQAMDGTSRPGPHLTVNTSAAEAFDAYTDRVDALFNDKPAYQAVLKESPRHRLILWMTAQGHSPQEIADALGISRQTVYTTRKQPWFREMFVRLTADIGKDCVSAFLKGEVLPSLQTLVEIRDTAEKPADRRAAADSLLDRYLGKPTAKVDSDAKAPADVPSEIDSLRAEHKRLADELRASGVTGFEPSTS